MMKELLLVRGLPGSGKTSFAQTIANVAHAGSAKMVAADDFMMSGGEYIFSTDKIHRAHTKCQATVELWMRGDVSLIIVHNTFTTEKEMAPYVALAARYGYTVRSVIVENRQDTTSIHGVPEETMEKMRNRFSVKL